ncbi:hypothetical protein [Microcoleus sp. herbarium14]|uniref:hypothetical protein n=1 Tax=Microcoleus sp. herbarium14 TaxID=3055439 RepID=UPI002FD5F0BE
MGGAKVISKLLPVAGRTDFFGLVLNFIPDRQTCRSSFTFLYAADGRRATAKSPSDRT